MQTVTEMEARVRVLKDELTAAEKRIAALERERDEARKVAGEFEEWLDEALEALGAKTVFDIKKRGRRVQVLEEALRGLYEWSKDYDAYTPAQNKAAELLAQSPAQEQQP